MFYFGDEPDSRHRFRLRKLLFWRRDPFSSPFFGEKSSILTTSPVLVTNLGRKMLNFDDEPGSRHRFRLRKLLFWRRDPFSSPFSVEKASILTTSPILVANLRLEMLNFDDEACSRHRF
ncbi:hypothetical protein NST17_03100 [Caldifermentibacillus hisashii]|uniref:Uncharacterized protein n=1 Tax=Caldifermentibacillus hisashii TaxID=996558 RepID=A0ABU9JTN9_9BACI